MTASEANRSLSRRGPLSARLDEPVKTGGSRRNGRATRQRILDAAFAEFAAAGFAGARVDRIAAHAGCTRSLIFVHFESKAALFEAVAGEELERINRELRFSAGDALQLAARLFDFAMGHPQSMRLLAWYGLETDADGRPEPPIPVPSHGMDWRSASPDKPVPDPFPAGFLPAAVIALSTAWSQGNLLGQILASSEHGEPGRLRDAVLEGVKRLAE